MSNLAAMKYYVFLFSILFLISCQNQPKETDNQEQTTQAESVNDDLVFSTDTINRFEPEMLRFDSLDQVNGYMDGGILFTGSSSIRMWSTLTEDMEGYTVLNRGFGGATIPEVLLFSNRYLTTHKPDIVVFYCGENDIAEGASPADVLASFKTFVRVLETKMPDAELVYITMKPSVSRWHLWEQYKAGDALIQEFAKTKDFIKIMDCSQSMLAKNGEVKKDIFIEDNLHMNAKGYAGWTAQLRPILATYE